MLSKMEDADDRNQHLLRPWVVACEGAMQLTVKDGIDRIRAMNAHQRLQHVQAVEAVGCEVPILVKAATAASAAEEKLQVLLAAKDQTEVMAAIHDTCDVIFPFEVFWEGAKKRGGWTWANPTFYALAMERHGSFEKKLILGEVDQDQQETMQEELTADMEAGSIEG